MQALLHAEIAEDAKKIEEEHVMCIAVSDACDSMLAKQPPKLGPGSCETHRAQHALDLPVQLLHGPVDAVHLVHDGQLLVLQNLHICQSCAPTRLGSIGLERGVSCLDLQGQCKKSHNPLSRVRSICLGGQGAASACKGKATGICHSRQSHIPTRVAFIDLMTGIDCLHLHVITVQSEQGCGGLKRALRLPLPAPAAGKGCFGQLSPPASSLQCEIMGCWHLHGQALSVDSRAVKMLPGDFKGARSSAHPLAGPLRLSSRPFSFQQRLLLHVITGEAPQQPYACLASRSACPTHPAAPPPPPQKTLTRLLPVSPGPPLPAGPAAAAGRWP